MPQHILLTGKPKSGKTTLLKKIIGDLKIPCAGFYTEEIIKGNKRIGFRIKTLEGKEGVLAMKGMKSRFRLGKYGINLRDLEEIGVKAAEQALRDKEIVIIDEIGKMELFSKEFKDVVLKTLNSKKRLIGVIHSSDSEFLNAIRTRKDVRIFEVDLDNHDEILNEINSMFDSL